MRLKIIPTLILLALPLALSACDQYATSQEKDYVAVIGKGTAKARPDFVAFDVTLAITKDTTDLATDAVSRSAADLIAALVDFGVSKDNITTDEFAVSADYEEVETEDDWIEQLVGYRAYYVLTVEHDDIGKAGALLRLVAAQNVFDIGDPEYKVEDEAELYAKARGAALRHARLKATEYATGLDRTLGAALIVEESRTKSYRLRASLQEDFAVGRSTYGSTIDEIIVTASKRESSIDFVPIVPATVDVSVELFVKHALE